MYGWRTRFGLIVPSSNTTTESEYHRILPPGVSIHSSRIYLAGGDTEALDRAEQDIEQAAELLATADVDVMVYGCTASSARHGPGYDEQLEEDIADLTGAPCIATAASIRRALDVLGAKSIAVTTPYIAKLNEQECSFLENAGYEVVAEHGLGLRTGLEMGKLTPERAYGEARRVDDSRADALLISCMNYPTFEAISALETDLGKPVVTSNQATLWDAFRAADIDRVEVTADLGQLFEC